MKVRKTGSRALLWGTICLAGIVTAFGLWQYAGSLLPSPAPKISYAEICDDPGKIGSPVIDVLLPTHLRQAINIAEGDDAAAIAARASVSRALPMGNIEWHVRNGLMTLHYKFAFSRQTLVEFVANCVYFGRDTNGVAKAAEVFFSKQLSQITLAEAAMLAGLMKAPSAYNPSNHPKRAKQRRNKILDQMFAAGKITAADMIVAKQEPVTPAKAGVQ